MRYFLALFTFLPPCWEPPHHFISRLFYVSKEFFQAFLCEFLTLSSFSSLIMCELAVYVCKGIILTFNIRFSCWISLKIQFSLIPIKTTTSNGAMGFFFCRDDTRYTRNEEKRVEKSENVYYLGTETAKKSLHEAWQHRNGCRLRVVLWKFNYIFWAEGRFIIYALVSDSLTTTLMGVLEKPLKIITISLVDAEAQLY